MRRLRGVFLAVAIVLLGSVGLLVARTFQSLALEEDLRHRSVADRAIDEMERALTGFLKQEDARGFGAYRFYFRDPNTGILQRSALADIPESSFVLGYFQLDDDGSFHTPHRPQPSELRQVGGLWQGSEATLERLYELEMWTDQLWPLVGPPAPQTFPQRLTPGTTETTIAPSSRTMLLNEEVLQRTKQAVSPSSAFNLAAETRGTRGSKQEQTNAYNVAADALADEGPGVHALQAVDVEVGPLVGATGGEGRLVLHRMVLAQGRTYRQGLFIDVDAFGEWLAAQLQPAEELGEALAVEVGAFDRLPPGDAYARYAFRHRFGEPFAALGATVSLAQLPGTAGSNFVWLLALLVTAASTLGLLALYRMAEATVQNAERRSNFVSAVTHELKTPLTVIRMYAEMLQQGMLPSEDKRQEYYRTITAESDRLGRLINNVLELSKLEKGQRDMEMVTDQLPPVLYEVTRTMTAHAQTEGFALEIDIDESLPNVRFDRDALVQILVNLVDNAMKYSREAADKSIAIGCREEGDGVLLTVRDYGPGVPAGEIDKIFEPFYRLGAELTRKTKGTGIGLALVRNLVDRMGGRAWARPADGGGLEVCLSLPAAG